MKIKVEDLEELPTVDLDGEELFSTGTYRGREYTEDDLDIMASSYTELPHYHRPVKIGHEESQPLTQTSAMPALGWVENVKRVGRKLVGDYKDVPAAFAQIIKAKGYRTSSAEILHDFTDPVTGKTFKHAYRAQAILGATFPQIKDLKDVAAAYTGFSELPEDNMEVIQFSEELSYEGIRRKVEAAINDNTAGYGSEPRPLTWIEETYPTHVITYNDGSYFKVPYGIVDGEVQLGEPVEVEKETSYVTKLAEELEAIQTRADVIRRVLKPEEGKTGGDEYMERNQLIETLGLAADVTDEAITAHLQGLRAKAEAPVPAAPDMSKFMDTESEAFKTLQADATAGRQALKNQYEDKKKGVLSGAVRAGVFLPAAYEKWSEKYDKDPEGITELLGTIQAGDTSKFEEEGSAGGGDEQPRTGQTSIEDQVEAFMEENPEKSYMDAYDHVVAQNKKEGNKVKEVRE